MKRLRVLVACEFSGIVREAFNAYSGVEAMSCDLLTPDDGRFDLHHTGDVREVLNDGWDLMIAHPPCTYLNVASVWCLSHPEDSHLHLSQRREHPNHPGRRQKQKEAVEFVKELWAAPIERVAIENPQGQLGTLWQKHTQMIQPYNFGADASKKTCLWLRGLPPLRGTKYVHPRAVCSVCGFVEKAAVEVRERMLTHGCPECGASHKKVRPRWDNQTDSGQNKLSPGPNRWKERSLTYPGIAQAMASQWLEALLK